MAEDEKRRKRERELELGFGVGGIQGPSMIMRALGWWSAVYHHQSGRGPVPLLRVYLEAPPLPCRGLVSGPRILVQSPVGGKGKKEREKGFPK
jgi:hypothetical protein